MIADYVSRGFRVTPLVWTRGVKGSLPDGTVAFTKKGLHGAGFRNAWYFLRWHLFISRFLIANAFRRNIVHCVDFDTSMIVVPLARILRKPIVYDAFDHFASSRRGLIAYLFHRAERILINAADVLILPDEARMGQYSLDPSRVQPCIISNVPDAKHLVAVRDREIRIPLEKAIHIVYIGTLEARHRGLEFIPRLCEDFPHSIRFTVGGSGTLDRYFSDHCARLSNLHYVGYQPYEDALRIMSDADVLYGPYLLSSKHHRFAAPNKMFEHIALGKPLITNRGTPPGRFVEENRTGYVFDGSYKHLHTIIGNLQRGETQLLGKAAYNLWQEKYSTWREQQVDSFFRRLEACVDAPQ
jgi:glycosyltransferase involved in cell wall biosynthesis